MNRTTVFWFLLIFLVGSVLWCVLLAWRHPSDYGVIPPCPSRALLGVYCPGCGSMRATHYLLRGRVTESLRYNPLVLPLLPLVTFLAARFFWEAWYQKSYRFRGETTFGVALLVLVCIWTVARNIPLEAFDVCRPPQPETGIERNMKLKPLVTLLSLFVVFSASALHAADPDAVRTTRLAIANSMLQRVFDKFHVEKYGLLLETFPVNQRSQVSYLAEGAAQRQSREVSYLWPYSGMLSATVALMRETDNDPAYTRILEERILPGLKHYWDDKRQPPCYQSYPTFAGKSDRFYDDNIWLAIDFVDLYTLTNNKRYLDRAVELHTYIYSGWSDKLGGGIYWCEQKQTSKNTCSNAPAAVLGIKLFQATGEQKYLDRAVQTYDWTVKNLRDPADSLYWDNIKIADGNANGNVNTAKYSYNSGQMIQAGVLLFQVTGKDEYLIAAQATAQSLYNHFAVPFVGKDGIEHRNFRNNPWFNVIAFRGLKALYAIDKNPTYVGAMIDVAEYAWNHTQDENRFLSGDWSGQRPKRYKWLLDNACMIEFFAEAAGISTR